MENNKRVIVRATEKYEFCCYLSDMGVERIYTVLAENEKDARERFQYLPPDLTPSVFPCTTLPFLYLPVHFSDLHENGIYIRCTYRNGEQHLRQTMRSSHQCTHTFLDSEMDDSHYPDSDEARYFPYTFSYSPPFSSF